VEAWADSMSSHSKHREPCKATILTLTAQLAFTSDWRPKCGAERMFDGPSSQSYSYQHESRSHSPSDLSSSSGWAGSGPTAIPPHCIPRTTLHPTLCSGSRVEPDRLLAVAKESIPPKGHYSTVLYALLPCIAHCLHQAQQQGTAMEFKLGEESPYGVL
jgi:hypothetical protein